MLKSPPSILLQPTQGTYPRDSRNREYPLTNEGTPIIVHNSSQTPEAIAAAYRVRYASYLAATFNISIEAAQADMNNALIPRRASSVSEAESAVGVPKRSESRDWS